MCRLSPSLWALDNGTPNLAFLPSRIHTFHKQTTPKMSFKNLRVKEMILMD